MQLRINCDCLMYAKKVVSLKIIFSRQLQFQFCKFETPLPVGEIFFDNLSKLLILSSLAKFCNSSAWYTRCNGGFRDGIRIFKLPACCKADGVCNVGMGFSLHFKFVIFRKKKIFFKMLWANFEFLDGLQLARQINWTHFSSRPGFPKENLNDKCLYSNGSWIYTRTQQYSTFINHFYSN